MAGPVPDRAMDVGDVFMTEAPSMSRTPDVRGPSPDGDGDVGPMPTWLTSTGFDQDQVKVTTPWLVVDVGDVPGRSDDDCPRLAVAVVDPDDDSVARRVRSARSGCAHWPRRRASNT